MIKKHETSTLIAKVDTAKLLSFFEEATAAVYKLIPIQRALTEYVEGEISEEDIYDELDDLRLSIQDIVLVGQCYVSVHNTRNKYLANISRQLQLFMENVKMLVNSGCWPSVEEARILEREAFTAVGGLAYIIVNEFELMEFIEQSQGGNGKADVDAIFSDYVKKYSLDALDTANGLVQISNDYKYRLEIFDEHPELEEQFERIAGPDYVLIPEGVLTLAMVQQVISGELTVAALLEQLMLDEE